MERLRWQTVHQGKRKQIVNTEKHSQTKQSKIEQKKRWESIGQSGKHHGDIHVQAKHHDEQEIIEAELF